MNSIKISAPAKLNLSLDVLKKREDGYHDMSMIMQTVSLCDELEITLRNDGLIKVFTDLKYLPCDDRNLAFKAASAYFQALEVNNLGADIKIKKHIPVCAGTAGGSSDAAAVLRGLNELCEKPFGISKLEELALLCGSDVPFLVAGGTSLAEGRGEILTPLPSIPDCSILVCKPDVSISTPMLFSRIDSSSLNYHPDTAGLINAINQGNLKNICNRMYNVFEEVLPKNCNDVLLIKRDLLELGAVSAIMTGTGSAVFGVFDNNSLAENAALKLKSSWPFVHLSKAVKRIKL